MADVKFTGLAAGAAPFDVDSVFALAEDDGAGTFASKKVTITQCNVLFGSDIAKLLDNGSTMDAEQKINFDPSGTNKQAIASTVGTPALIFTGSDNGIYCTADGGITLTEGYFYAEDVEAWIGFNSGNAAEACFDGTSAIIFWAGTSRMTADATGIGFFNTTPAAQPTGVAVSAAGIHAALVTLGLITA